MAVEYSQLFDWYPANTDKASIRKLAKRIRKRLALKANSTYFPKRHHFNSNGHIAVRLKGIGWLASNIVLSKGANHRSPVTVTAGRASFSVTMDGRQVIIKLVGPHKTGTFGSSPTIFELPAHNPAARAIRTGKGQAIGGDSKRAHKLRQPLTIPPKSGKLDASLIMVEGFTGARNDGQTQWTMARVLLLIEDARGQFDSR